MKATVEVAKMLNYYLTPAEFSIYTYLKSTQYYEKTSRIRTPYLTVCKDLRMSSKTVLRAMKFMWHLGLIRKERNHCSGLGQARQYRLCDFKTNSFIYTIANLIREKHKVYLPEAIKIMRDDHNKEPDKLKYHYGIYQEIRKEQAESKKA